MLKVFQIQLSNWEVDSINAGAKTEKSKAYFDRNLGEYKPENFKYYDHVANVATNDLEEAFALMNLWEDESKIERLSRRLSSMSVGDIVETENGDRFRVASFGFDQI